MKNIHITFFSVRSWLYLAEIVWNLVCYSINTVSLWRILCSKDKRIHSKPVIHSFEKYCKDNVYMINFNAVLFVTGEFCRM